MPTTHSKWACLSAVRQGQADAAPIRKPPVRRLRSAAHRQEAAGVAGGHRPAGVQTRRPEAGKCRTGVRVRADRAIGSNELRKKAPKNSSVFGLVSGYQEASQGNCPHRARCGWVGRVRSTGGARHCRCRATADRPHRASAATRTRWPSHRAVRQAEHGEGELQHHGGAGARQGEQP